MNSCAASEGSWARVRPSWHRRRSHWFAITRLRAPALLAVGIPLYGRGFAVAEPYASTKYAAKTGVPRGDYNNLHRLEHEKGWKRIYDAETKNPWLIAPDHQVVVGYDDDGGRNQDVPVAVEGEESE